MRRLAIGLLALPAMAAASPAEEGFSPGEGMTFSVSVGMIEAGRARMSVGAPVRKGERRVAALHGEAHGPSWLSALARLDDDYRVVFDVGALLPREVVSDETGVRTRRIDSRFAGRALRLDYRDPKLKVHQGRLLPGEVRDPATALFWLRSRPLAAGERYELLVLDGAALYRAEAVVEGREPLPRADGAAQAVRVEIVATRIDDRGRPDGRVAVRHITLWLSDDRLRVPYRIVGDTDLGRAQVELTSYVDAVGSKLARRVALPTRPPTP